MAPSKVESHRDLVYAKHRDGPLKLDVYVPKDIRRPPVVVWFHGGGWRYGDKRYRFLLRGLTDEGFAVATVDYRLSKQAKWPAQREDCQAAVRWLGENAAALGIDAGRLGLAGDSAGGHLAALLGVLDGTPRIKAVVAIHPPTDLRALAHFHGDKPTSLLTDLLGGTIAEKAREAAEASPVNFVDADDPPFLFLHGDRDKVVPHAQSIALQNQLRACGVEAALVPAEGKGHAYRLDEKEFRAVADFFRRNL